MNQGQKLRIFSIILIILSMPENPAHALDLKSCFTKIFNWIPKKTSITSSSTAESDVFFIGSDRIKHPAKNLRFQQSTHPLNGRKAIALFANHASLPGAQEVATISYVPYFDRISKIDISVAKQWQGQSLSGKMFDQMMQLHPDVTKIEAKLTEQNQSTLLLQLMEKIKSAPDYVPESNRIAPEVLHDYENRTFQQSIEITHCCKNWIAKHKEKTVEFLKEDLNSLYFPEERSRHGFTQLCKESEFFVETSPHVEGNPSDFSMVLIHTTPVFCRSLK